jgi:murein DD-endopeptidase MepM/ murein hydrolase activator NlpD
VHTPLADRAVTIGRKLTAGRLSAVGLAATLLLSALVTVADLGGPAGASPQPTPAQAKKLLARLNQQATKLGQQYATVIQQLVIAQQQLKVLGEQTAIYQGTVDAKRQQVARLAITAYEQGFLNSPLAVLLSASPQRLLRESSILSELSAADVVQIRQFLNANRVLAGAERMVVRTRARIFGLKRALGKRLKVLIALNKREGNLLPLLTLVQLATSGHPYVNPLRAVSGLTPERVDMGVDFNGTGPVYAIGAGVVTNEMANNGGWPGGGWITYQLIDGPAVGEVVYVAEDITPAVQAGQKVTFRTVIGNMFSGGSGIETGWAMPDSASSESELPEAGGLGGLGPFPTAIGVNFEYLLQALGVPAARYSGQRTFGLVPPRYQIDWAKALR